MKFIRQQEMSVCNALQIYYICREVNTRPGTAGEKTAMIPFLKQIASAYYDRGDIENTCFIFPNRRSEVFFVKYLSDLVAGKNAGGEDPVPLKVPDTCTINDFIYRIYGITPTARITLLLELYTVYAGLFRKAETLDEFIFWGDIIIGDFNDVDKYMADASQLFTNIADLKSIQDSFSYLSETQRKAVEAFISHFSDRNGRLTVNLESDDPKVKERFLQIWNILYPLYKAYRTSLQEKNMAYEGMVYRDVAERFSSGSPGEILSQVFPYAQKFVFTGLNALNECEKTVMRRMREMSLAEFCWDYSGSMIRDRYNKSSFFMDSNIREFPPTVMTDAEEPPLPDIRVVSVPSSVGQVKQLPNIFRTIADTCAGGDLSKVGILKGRSSSAGADCAIVLPDESLLMPVLNTIPPEIRDINVTMGYPVTAGSFYMFMSLVMDLQMNLRKKGDIWYFYHRQVRTLFSDSIFRAAAGEDGLAGIDRIKSRGQLFIPASDLDAGGIFSTVFRPVVTGKSSASHEDTDAFASYLLEVIESAVPALKAGNADKVELEFAIEFHKTISSLRKNRLPVRPATWIRILKQILAPVSVPFKGEPLQGLQIMGPLETRVLDFENLVIMSANEGVFPRRSVSSSFIPPELRRGFGLPTYEYQDAVWAYYFYRMLSRATNVWLLYDSRTEGMKSGEESRYIKQLQYHFNIPLKRYEVSVALSETTSPESVPKTVSDVEFLKNIPYSASSISEYLDCPAKFYYDKVKNLGKEEELAEELDAGLFGTVYHEMMQTLYHGEDAMKSGLPVSEWITVAEAGNRPREITGEYLSSWLKREDEIRSKVRSIIMRNLNAIEVTGKNLVTVDVIVRYVMKTLSADLEILEHSPRGSIRMHGLEKRCVTDFHGFTLKGVVDRVDSVCDGEIRIVDYKTGLVEEKAVSLTESDPAGVAKAVFDRAPSRKRPKIALQLYIYDKFMRQDQELAGQAMKNCVYSVRSMFARLPESYPVEESFISEMDAGMESFFSELTDVSVPFRLTTDSYFCENCDFKTICGR